MLAKRTNATISGAKSIAIGKVVGLEDMSASEHPVEKCILDSRFLPESAPLNELLRLPWMGVLARDGSSQEDERLVISSLGDDAVVSEGDVIRVGPSSRYVEVLYRRGANANALFVTERCNNFCIMCSQPPREVDDRWRYNELMQVVDLIDPTDHWLGITGGEPTLLGQQLFELLGRCAERLPHTALHVLSNGRRFADEAYAKATGGLHRELTWGIPLYGDVAHLHDYVVQQHGAFADTVRGLYHLSRAEQTIEIRVVLVKDTVARLTELAKFIAWNFPFVSHVALMGVEPQGFAKANYQAVWQDPVEFADGLQDAVATLHNRGVQTSIYNLPLCVLPRTLWPFARRSISDWKNTYLPACSGCCVRERCCGFFASIDTHWVSRAIAPITYQSEAVA